MINFRDFGAGVEASAGLLRPGMLFRCGQMSDLDEQACANLLATEFDLIIDLRHAKERQNAPSPWPQHYEGRILCTIDSNEQDAPHMMLLGSMLRSADEVDERYFAFYQRLPYDDVYAELFGRALAAIARTRGKLLVHCSAGKDRTGIFVALLLSCMGVAWTEIIDDYLRSQAVVGNPVLRAEVASRVTRSHGVMGRPDILDAILSVKAAFIEASFAAIRARSGSVDAYLDAIGVDHRAREILRQSYLAT